MEKILLEGRVEDFKNKYSKNFSSEQLKRIIDLILPKYLNWVGKSINTIDFDQNLQTINDALKKFDKISSNLTKTDLYQYKSVDELVDELKKYEEKQRRNAQKVKGGNLVYDDDRFYVVNPLTHEASCYYGKGTKWCTTTTSDYNFNKYNEESKLFYVIDKRLKTDDPYYKVAILKNFDGGEQYWDARDNSFSKGWILGTEEYDRMKKEISNYMDSEFAEQIKIFSDKELAKKEKQRLERLRIQRETQRKKDEAEERRLNDEWAFGPNCPEEGLMAHALLTYLIDEGDVEELTESDKVRMSQIKDELEVLDVVDDVDTISELEEELEELESKVDVYYMVPLGTHYNMTTFECLKDDLYGREYMVGDEDNTRRSAEEATESLIDDIGYEGFNKSFVSSHIDSEKVRDYAYDFYYDDVYDNPDSFFEDEQRMLSTSQKEEIDVKEKKIKRMQSEIEGLESELEDKENDEEIEELESIIEDLQDSITELEEEIEDIKDSPDGDFPDDLIEEKASDLADDAESDPETFISDMGLDLTEFINKDSFIEDVIDSDGYGSSIGSYDGDINEYRIEGESYYVARYN
jgi:hypothetical protein